MASTVDSETRRNIDASVPEVLKEIKNAGLFQSITVEYYANGTIKRIERNLDIKNVLTLGAFTIVGGVTIYFVGPSNVIEIAKAAIAAAEAVHTVNNRVQGRPMQRMQYN